MMMTMMMIIKWRSGLKSNAKRNRGRGRGRGREEEEEDEQLL